MRKKRNRAYHKMMITVKKMRIKIVTRRRRRKTKRKTKIKMRIMIIMDEINSQ